MYIKHIAATAIISIIPIDNKDEAIDIIQASNGSKQTIPPISIIVPKQPNFSLDDFNIRNPININGIAMSIPLTTSLEFGSPKSGVGRYLPLKYPSEEIKKALNVLKSITILFCFCSHTTKEGVSLTLVAYQKVSPNTYNHANKESPHLYGMSIH